jgi:hypothetical protein
VAIAAPQQGVEHNRRAARVQPDTPNILEVGQGLLDQRFVRLVDRRVNVALEHGEQQPVAQQDLRALGVAELQRLGAERRVDDIPRTHLAQALLRPPNARFRTGAEHRGAHRDHVPVQHAQDGGPIDRVWLAFRRLCGRDPAERRAEHQRQHPADAVAQPSPHVRLASLCWQRGDSVHGRDRESPVTATRQPRPSRRPIRVR